MESIVRWPLARSLLNPAQQQSQFRIQQIYARHFLKQNKTKRFPYRHQSTMQRWRRIRRVYVMVDTPSLWSMASQNRVLDILHPARMKIMLSCCAVSFFPTLFCIKCGDLAKSNCKQKQRLSTYKKRWKIAVLHHSSCLDLLSTNHIMKIVS